MHSTYFCVCIPLHVSCTSAVTKATSNPLIRQGKSDIRTTAVFRHPAPPSSHPVPQMPPLHVFRLSAADETLSGGLMKSQGLSCGLMTQALFVRGGPPLSTAS